MVICFAVNILSLWYQP